MNSRQILAGVVVFAAVAMAILAVAQRFGSQANSPEATPPAPPPVVNNSGTQTLRFARGSRQLASIKIAQVESAPVPLSEPLPGRIAYNENFTSRLSVPIAGRVTSIRADVGDSVRAGAVLVVIDAPDMASARSDVQKAQADENLKRKAVERIGKLLQAGVVARKEMEAAESDHSQAVAELQRTQSRLKNLVPNGLATESGYTLTAPLSGVITERQINMGMEVRPDMQAPLFVVSDPTKLWVLVDVPERSIAKVARGNPLSIETDAYPDVMFHATIERVGETLDPATRRIQIRAVVDNRDHRLKPEMFARATLLADGHRKAVRVPNSALIVDGLYTYLFVEIEPGTFEKRRIELLVQDRQWAYLAGGLKDGEKIVSTGPLLLATELKSAK